MKLRCSAIWSDAVIRVTAIAHLLNFTQKQGPVENVLGKTTQLELHLLHIHFISSPYLSKYLSPRVRMSRNWIIGFAYTNTRSAKPHATTYANRTCVMSLSAPYAALEFARLAQVRSISGWAARWLRTLFLLPSWALGTETRRWPILHWTTYGVRESYLDDRLLLHILLLQYLYLSHN